ncbi:S-adenosyl-L-methionine-dependent methyltransferase [Fimicolochytrium jonesii]|uniref:S-adenosyl-L-methionine-dependent methyltransferase n=1 Tax=Fimicolochytrium jonesii TaxID=1396493 RepID=UPI0022FED083|nr:S-adenosyl-L-methionine-dependent methyltransferase [Fimicolochytrium jonesii]KAI8816993.1 S-adenosyl-L-methionine-dependent methyltransferase [Fimicolochytrium jonesii]
MATFTTTTASFESTAPSNLNDDDTLRSTNDDASISRLAAVNLGYLSDPYAKHFVRRGQKRPPVINRGTFTRSKALETLIDQFLDVDPRGKQIVSLGAGSDTRNFLLKAAGRQPRKYFEIDFPEIVSKKGQTIARNPTLATLVGPYKIDRGGLALHGSDYHLLSGDLRTFASHLIPHLQSLGLDTTLPTLFLCECVLIYLPPALSRSILNATSSLVRSGGGGGMFVVYEQIHPDDAFGRVMAQNLRGRGIELRGWREWPDLKAQKRRFGECGWEEAGAVDMNMFWEGLGVEERGRISKLEIFDEVEEWQLLSDHYCVSWAVIPGETEAGDQERMQRIGLCRS